MRSLNGFANISLFRHIATIGLEWVARFFMVKGDQCHNGLIFLGRFAWLGRFPTQTRCTRLESSFSRLRAELTQLPGRSTELTLLCSH
jgi:hypothetical protein